MLISHSAVKVYSILFEVNISQPVSYSWSWSYALNHGSSVSKAPVENTNIYITKLITPPFIFDDYWGQKVWQGTHAEMRMKRKEKRKWSYKRKCAGYNQMWCVFFNSSCDDSKTEEVIDLKLNHAHYSPLSHFQCTSPCVPQQLAIVLGSWYRPACMFP